MVAGPFCSAVGLLPGRRRTAAEMAAGGGGVAGAGAGLPGSTACASPSSR
jgi:hypothetical protein